MICPKVVFTKGKVVHIKTSDGMYLQYGTKTIAAKLDISVHRFIDHSTWRSRLTKHMMGSINTFFGIKLKGNPEQYNIRWDDLNSY